MCKYDITDSVAEVRVCHMSETRAIDIFDFFASAEDVACPTQEETMLEYVWNRRE